jgi:K+-transporting ATPase ATPase C chain
MSWRRDISTAVRAMIVFTLALGLAYPLAITAISQLAFPGRANGQRITVAGRTVGSKLIGQAFTDAHGPVARYFQTRPSATTPADNAAASTFSNLGPNNIATEKQIGSNVQGYLALERPYVPGLTAARVPVDAADSSASGIDPEISLANAHIQAHRVAAVRRLALSRVDALVAQSTTGRSLGLLGEPGVNVLTLNVALDRLGGGDR